ncbi:glycosyltransferase family 4 protein [Ancylothrix sp. C2]|uniref:glycosyltransferase family 4 protein n=1 Tax=Ancylothrix sp. D3o TaxID=2953691 RepID=UPI0021BAE7FF|nr:glycosyltransferase family 4 protein [Ancylothrix sp. D3o]MCT7950089.1 glycosyltransferase family 4 protein [Ancylothrix sp. D3o]
MKIIIISTNFPYPPTGGTTTRTYNLLKYLNRHHQITLVTQTETTDNQHIETLKKQVTHLKKFPRTSQNYPKTITGKLQRFGQFLTTGTPPNVRHYYSPAMQNWIDQHIAENPDAIITCEHSINEIYIRPEWKNRKILNIHSSIYATAKAQIETGISENPLRDWLQIPLLRQYEKRHTAKFSHLVVTTEQDKKFIQPLNPNIPISIIPNGVMLEKFPNRTQDPGGYNLIFAGAMDNLANIDAARYLALEILPKVQQNYPQTHLTLVGTNPKPAIKELSKNPAITVTGKVESVAEYLHQATVCVIPMRVGFGIKNKTLEAMATGVPVVASERGLEGISLQTPTGLTAIAANNTSEYIDSIVRLFENPQLRQQISQNARSLIENAYTWESVGKCYEQVLMD